MHKKDLGLLVLILIVGAVTASLNPRFLSPVNLINMANLIGLFGLFSIGVGLVIIYCFLYYRALGLVVVLSLAVSGVTVYASLVLLGETSATR